MSDETDPPTFFMCRCGYLEDTTKERTAGCRAEGVPHELAVTTVSEIMRIGIVSAKPNARLRPSIEVWRETAATLERRLCVHAPSAFLDFSVASLVEGRDGTPPLNTLHCTILCDHGGNVWRR